MSNIELFAKIVKDWHKVAVINTQIRNNNKEAVTEIEPSEIQRIYF